MDTLPTSMQKLAQRLLDASQTASDPHVDAVVLVSERLRIPLTTFAGADGFASLLRRAVALASTGIPALRSAKVTSEGRLEGMEGLVSREENVASEEALAITAHLLWLLVTFIGEPLTMKLVREAFPDTSPDD